MKTPKVILINGLKRSGKDFSGDILLKKLPNSKKIAFADNMKKIISETLGITLRELEDYKNNYYYIKTPDSSLSFRELLQRFGTEAMKPVFGNDVWARLVKDEILKSSADYIIISDFRFLVEYETLKDLDTLGAIKLVTLKINDNNLQNKDTHISENELNDFEFDYQIDNTKKDPGILEDYLDSFIKIKVL
jgi:hypothetical protein